MNRVWKEPLGDKPGAPRPVRYARAVFMLNDGSGLATRPVHIGWWKYEHGKPAAWRPWRPRWYRRALRQRDTYR